MANNTGKKFGGRAKGTPNKTTVEIKEAINQIVSDNLESVQGWIDEVATDSPKDALRIILDLMEYSLPKLNRTTAEIIPPESLINRVDLLFPPIEEIIAHVEDN
jgi:hypothetical protein